MQTLITRFLQAIFLTFVIAVLTIPGFRSHIFFLNFVDEDDNIVIANYVTEGQELYRDVYTQHQPLPFYLSASLQSITQPDNILLVVKRHREFMMLWSLIWIFLLIFRFGSPLFFTALILELVKINLLGNLFLAESLVIYPLIYILAYYLSRPNKVNHLEDWLISILIWVLIFALAPIWPLLGVLLLVQIYTSSNRIYVFSRIVLIGICFGLLIFGRGTLLDFWHDVVYINYQFYIPLTSTLGTAESLYKAFIAPLLVFFNESSSALLSFIQLLSIGFLLELYFLIKDKQVLRAFAWVIILFLANIRYIDPSETLYGAFHMLPWFSVYVFTVVTELKRLWFSRGLKQLTAKFIIILLVIGTISLASASLWDKRDPVTDFYINYSPLVDLSKVVEILSRDSEQAVWVEPVFYWPYWKTGAKQYSEMINYYGWMDLTPPMKNTLNDLLVSELPTIVWAKTQEGIGPYLTEYYQFRRDGKLVDLYLRKDKLNSISPDSLQELSYYRFEIN